MEKVKYKFSVIIPIYNTEEYLRESIDSVIKQDIGFKKNIQLILVNDGSKDNSKEICLEYQKQYPDNIKYVEQENAGVSAARNNGMKYIEGKYTNFLDSDDKWNSDAFSKVYRFFEKNEEKISVVACRQKFFEARNDFHPLDYKFEKTGIIDISEKFSYIQLHVTSIFIKSSILEKYKFDTELKYSEDLKFITEILLDTKKYGVVSEAIHNYRKREDNSSAIQNKTKSLDWYMKVPTKVYKELIDLSIKQNGLITKYIQYVIMYDMQWRLKESVDILDEKQLQEYKKTITELLKNIDDSIICMQKKLDSEYKIYALSLKYGRNVADELTLQENKLYFNNIAIFNIKRKTLFRIEEMNVKGDNLELEGEINTFIPSQNYSIYAMVNDDKTYEVEYLPDETNNRESLGKVFLKNRRYIVKIPLENAKTIKMMIRYKGIKTNTRKLTMTLGKFVRLNNNSYKVDGDYIIRCNKNRILIYKNDKSLKRKFEIKYLWYLFKMQEFRIIEYRLLYFLCKKFIKKPIWIISDRVMKAGDNGEALYRYIYEKGLDKDKNIYFTLKHNSEDYKKMKKIGKVLKYGSIKYKICFLFSSFIISSQANDWVINAFYEKENLISDLYKFKFVFLQHGIISNDLSKWLRKYNKNISLFITATRKEYASIIHGNYMYSEKEVKLTGSPRYDRLKSKTNKKIIFMPTWRRSLEGKTKKGTSEYLYNDKFKNSEYCKFYNKLINDERILKCLKDNGYTGEFFVHPCFEKQAKDFNGNELIKVSNSIADYSKEFSEADFLITDYSSVTFDFAYLKKPVLYIQYDLETFYDSQMYDKGKDNIEKDGFGPVCYNYEDAVKQIIKIVKGKCKEDKVYEKRVKEFFEYTDKHNCKRVYKEILKLSNDK